MLNDTANVVLLDDTPVASAKSISGDTHSGKNTISDDHKRSKRQETKASVAKSLVESKLYQNEHERFAKSWLGKILR